MDAFEQPNSTAEPSLLTRRAVDHWRPLLLHNFRMVNLFVSNLDLETDRETRHPGGIGYARGRMIS